MQDAKGNILVVGQSVSFPTWDNSKKVPVAGSTLGTILRLEGESRENQTIGDAVLDTDEGEVTVAGASVTITTEKRKAKAAPAAKSSKKTTAKKSTAAATPAAPAAK